MKDHTKELNNLNACEGALEFADKYGSLQEAWDNCEHGDWMLWYLGKKSGPPESNSRKKLVLCVCKCARLAWEQMPEEGRKAIEIAEKYAKDEGPTLNDVKKASAAAAAAYGAAAAASAAYASYAASAAYASFFAAAAAAKGYKEALMQCAEIVRTEYPILEKRSDV